jgi:hypothetical protein
MMYDSRWQLIIWLTKKSYNGFWLSSTCIWPLSYKYEELNQKSDQFNINLSLCSLLPRWMINVFFLCNWKCLDNSLVDIKFLFFSVNLKTSFIYLFIFVIENAAVYMHCVAHCMMLLLEYKYIQWNPV